MNRLLLTFLLSWSGAGVGVWGSDAVPGATSTVLQHPAGYLVLFSPESAVVVYDPPPDYELTLPAACGPSPEGDCDVFYWTDRIATADFEGGEPEFTPHYQHRRVCCGGTCMSTYPLQSGLPVVIPENELRAECVAVSTTGGGP